MTDVRTVVVTGAGRGLGLATARRAGQDGFRVLLAELDEQRGRSAARQLQDEGVDARFVPCDIGDPDSVATMAATVGELGPLHGLVNNAGMANGVGGAEFQDIDVAAWDRMMRVNARGPWLVTRALLPLLLERGDDNGGSRVINLASDAALYGSPRLAHYIASKGAVLALTRAMARELGDRGVTVNAVAPGLTECAATETVPPQRHELYRRNRAISRAQQPDDLTGVVAFLLSGDSRYLTGQVIAVNGGFTMH